VKRGGDIGKGGNGDWGVKLLKSMGSRAGRENKKTPKSALRRPPAFNISKTGVGKNRETRPLGLDTTEVRRRSGKGGDSKKGLVLGRYIGGGE